MIAALLFIAILDIGPLIGISDNDNAVLTLLAALIFVVVHGYIAPGWRKAIWEAVTRPNMRFVPD